MEPARHLDEALRGMTFSVHPERFVLVELPRASIEGARSALAGSRKGDVVSVVLDGAAVTLFVREGALERLVVPAEHRIERQQRLITFDAPMGWGVVGFLALVARVLAEARVPIGVVCSFERDHVFVKEEFLEPARAALRAFVCAERAR